MASHASEQNGIFGPPATVSASPLVFTRIASPFAVPAQSRQGQAAHRVG